MTKLMLIDGSSLLHRAFYALPLLSNADGVFTNAVHGFMMMFNRMTAERKPDLLAVCFDKSRHTFRNEIFAQYKGTRSETPDELRPQFELVKQALQLSGVRYLEMEGYEADDLLGTLSAMAVRDDITVEIFSGDRDIFQLIGANTTVFMTRRGISDLEVWDEKAVKEKYGVVPPHMADLKGLMGDSSDNIPGIPGIGEKTAVKLLTQFGDLDTLYANLEQIKGKLREKLENGRDIAYKSRELATICRTVPMEVDMESLRFDARHDKSALAAFYTQLGLRQLLRGLGSAADASGSTTPSSVKDMPLDNEERPWLDADEFAAVAPGEVPSGICALLFCDHTLLVAQAGLAVMPFDPAQHKSILEDAQIGKVCVDAKSVIKFLAEQGITLNNLRDDVLIAAYLLDPSCNGYELSAILTENNLPYADDAVNITWLPKLADALRKRLEELHMLALYENMELPLISVLADMERSGIRVNKQGLAELSQEFSLLCADYQQKIFADAGHEFNLNSPKQLGVVLFEEMGIPPLKKTKTGYSTDAEVLETLALMYPIARNLLDYRLAAKLKSTYTDGMAKLIAEDGKIHTTFTQTVTATGRLSSVEPNLQNIPIRQELGRRIRRVFTADKPGDVLLAADYNQIELRVLAHMSGDALLKQAYINGEDIHRRTAAEVLAVPLDAVTPEQRRAAKAVNFGIVYGISDYGLSRDLGISRKEAADYIARYFERYPDVHRFQKTMIEEAKSKGYAETLFGRRRYLPDLHSRNFNLRSFAERVAVNAPIQGTAADIIKLAMINLAAEMKQCGLASKLLLQVHDELIFNVPADELDKMLELVKQKMEGAVALDIPLTVDVKTGYDWYNMEKVKEYAGTAGN